MYKIYADDLCFYNDESPGPELKITNPNLKLSDNSAGSLTFTLPPCNVAYDVIQHLSTYIYVYRDDEEIWSGRVIDEKRDFWNNRALTCEGRLAFLNDTVQPTGTYSPGIDASLRGLMTRYITTHNAQMSQTYSDIDVNDKKRFSIGSVSASLSSKWYRLISSEPNDSELLKTDYESTFDCFRSKIIEHLGGHLLVVKRSVNNQVQYQIDYLDDDDLPNMVTQTINFGSNLTDFVQNYDMTSLITAVIPLGARLSEIDEDVDSDERLTTDAGQVCADEDIVRKYGYIAKVVEWGDVKTKERLQTLAEEYIEDVQFDSMVLQISAVDLHYLNPSIAAFNLLDRVRCVSKPHGLSERDRTFVITEIDISLDDPSNTKYTLGKNETRSISDVGGASNRNTKTQVSDVSSWVSNLIKNRTETILAEARANAGSIMDQRANGYVTFLLDSDGTPKEIRISDTKDYTRAQKYWRGNVNGIAYYNAGTMDEPKTAWTMDGSFCADFITTGTLDAGLVRVAHLTADMIEAGVLTSLNFNGLFQFDSQTGRAGLIDPQHQPTEGSYFNLNTGYIGVYGTGGQNVYGAEMSSGRFRTLLNGDELGGLGTAADIGSTTGVMPWLFYNNQTGASSIGIGYKNNSGNDYPLVTISSSEWRVYFGNGLLYYKITQNGFVDANGNQVYAKPSDIPAAPDLSNYATKSDLSGYVTTSDLSGYATKWELSDYVALAADSLGQGRLGRVQNVHSVTFDGQIGGRYIAGNSANDGLVVADGKQVAIYNGWGKYSLSVQEDGVYIRGRKIFDSYGNPA